MGKLVVLIVLLALSVMLVPLAECQDSDASISETELLAERDRLKEALKDVSNLGNSVPTPVEEELEDDDEDWEDIEDDEVETISSGASSAAIMGRARNSLKLLNDKNAEGIISSYEHVMVLGYAPWCKQSAAVMEEYASAASILLEAGNSVILAKIDATANPITASRYGIKGFPTILFFTNGSEQIYTAGLTKYNFVNWIRKRTGYPATTVVSAVDAEEIQKKNATLVIGLFEKFDGPEYEEFLAAAIEDDGLEFVQISIVDAAKAFSQEMKGVPPALGLWKNEPDYFVAFDGEFKKDGISTFVSLNKYPLVTTLNSQNVAKVYASPVKRQVLLFSTVEEFARLYPLYLSAARNFKGQVMFLWLDIADEDLSRPMLAMYGIQSTTEPLVTGFDNNNGARYLLESEITIESVEGFAEKFVKGELGVHYKSEPIPLKNKGDVKIVVGKTFQKIVLSSSRDIFLQVYTPWCSSCAAVDKVFEKLAKHFKGTHSLIFAKLDGAANEHPALQVNNYPALLFYPAGSKDRPPVSPASMTKLKVLLEFVKSHVGNPLPETLLKENAGEKQTEGTATRARSNVDVNHAVKDEL